MLSEAPVGSCCRGCQRWLGGCAGLRVCQTGARHRVCGGDTVVIGSDEGIDNDLCTRLSSIKRHIANAYGKLSVGHRTEAVHARPNELNPL